MEGNSWQIIYQLAVIVVALLAGGAAVEVIDWLKRALGLEGNGALAVTALVAVLLTLATMVVEHVLTPGAVGVDNFGAVFVTIFMASQVRFRMLREQADRAAG
jgi:hypothetical protein